MFGLSTVAGLTGLFSPRWPNVLSTREGMSVRTFGLLPSLGEVGV